MTPERKITRSGHLIEEYYWAGDLVVYIDGRLTPQTYDEAVARCTPEPVEKGKATHD